jgi:VanZ family protein
VLISYASLYPFANWRDLGVPPLAFVDAAWPRYWTVFDLAVNILAYLPLGFLLALALRRLPGGRWSAAIIAVLLRQPAQPRPGMPAELVAGARAIES